MASMPKISPNPTANELPPGKCITLKCLTAMNIDKHGIKPLLPFDLAEGTLMLTPPQSCISTEDLIAYHACMLQSNWKTSNGLWKPSITLESPQPASFSNASRT